MMFTEEINKRSFTNVIFAIGMATLSAHSYIS